MEALSSLQSLNISGNNVGDLAPLASLHALKRLFIANTPVSDLSSLARLFSLETLYASQTGITDVQVLADLFAVRTLSIWGTAVSTLAPLANLSALQILSAWETQITDIQPLSDLSNLQTLEISSTLVNNLSPIAKLLALQNLDISDTWITDLDPLAGLSKLRQLALRNTAVAQVAPLAGLTALTTLDISYTRVSDLSPLLEHIRRGMSVKWETQGVIGIYVKECPLTNPPPEIIRQGNEAILNYFTERARGGVDHLYEAKMLILGEGGVGKTSLLRRLYMPEQELPTEKETTRGITIHEHEFEMKNGRTFRLNIWDFGGQQIYHSTHQFFLTHRSLYVLVDDTRRDYKSVSDEGFKYWLELVDVFGGHSPTLIFQNEKDNRSKAIDIAGIRQRYDNVKELFAGNLEHPNAADRLRVGIEHFASNLPHIGQELPARWLKVRADIEGLARNSAYVPVERYFEIYEGHIEFDETKALLLSRYLHDLGVFLHFQDDPLLARTVILQNEWATNAVFRILDDETVKKRFGRFDNGDCARLWQDSVYARKHLELLALMRNFELCYELRDSNPSTWLAPQLLPPAKPEVLKEWGRPEDLVVRYRYEFLPKGMISRLTVRLHRFVHNPEMAWITGVLFERGGSAVCVEVLPNGNEIELRARGEERKELLSVIADDLDALNDSFAGLRDRVEKRIPCNCSGCQIAAQPEFFGHKRLLQRKKDGKLKVECPRSYEEVDVLRLLDGVRVDQLPGWANEKEPSITTLRTIRIFLASSSELRNDRDEFEVYVHRQNEELLKRGLVLQVERWETFFDAISQTRKQEDYNRVVRQCDIFVSLFSSKVGAYTEEEFDVAYTHFKGRGKPLIYTFFKDTPIPVNTPRPDLQSLWAFQDKLRELGHYPTEYKSTEDLKLQFRGQLDKLLAKVSL